MILNRSEKIALEEYIGAAEELYAHLAGERQNPPMISFLVRQMADARPRLLEMLRQHQGAPLPQVG